MTKDEQTARRIAKRAMRELFEVDNRVDVQENAIREAESYRQALYVRKHVRIYSRQLAAALRKMP